MVGWPDLKKYNTAIKNNRIKHNSRPVSNGPTSGNIGGLICNSYFNGRLLGVEFGS